MYSVFGCGLPLSSAWLGALGVSLSSLSSRPNHPTQRNDSRQKIMMMAQIMSLRVMRRLIPLLCLAGLALGCESRTSKYNSIIKDIQTGVLIVSTNGVVRLPQQFAGLTPKDEVYAETKPDGRILVLFPTWYGRGSDVEGSLYCSGSLQPSDYYTIDWGAGGKRQHIDVADHDMLSVRAIRPHWYFASRRLD
jgi:hypothetical protein